jgi:hypothetical protein
MSLHIDRQQNIIKHEDVVAVVINSEIVIGTVYGFSAMGSMYSLMMIHTIEEKRNYLCDGAYWARDEYTYRGVTILSPKQYITPNDVWEERLYVRK